MRQFTKSVCRFSWAMSLVGLQQAANWMPGRGGPAAAAKICDAVSGSLRRQLGEGLEGGYQVQSGLVDTVSGLFSRAETPVIEAWTALERARLQVASDHEETITRAPVD